MGEIGHRAGARRAMAQNHGSNTDVMWANADTERTMSPYRDLARLGVDDRRQGHAPGSTNVDFGKAWCRGAQTPDDARPGLDADAPFGYVT